MQISTDGNFSYEAVIPTVFAQEVDFAQVIKEYEKGKYVSERKKKVAGNPVYDLVSTSLMERHNLTTRMSLRRYTRKTNAHSKKALNHYLSLALYFVWYNFIRIHSTIKSTPAVHAGITNHVHELEHILDLIDALEVMKKYETMVQ